GFMHGNPGKDGQTFDNGNSEYSAYRFTGLIKEYDPQTKRIKVEARNVIRIGQTHELCLPSANVSLEIKELFDHKGNSVEEIHGGSQACWISCPQDPGPFSVLREKIHEFDPQKVIFA